MKLKLSKKTIPLIVAVIVSTIGAFYYTHIATQYAINRDKRRIFDWLQLKTSNPDNEIAYSTLEISNATKLKEKRVLFICSIHEGIGKTMIGKWGIKKQLEEEEFYEHLTC